MLTVMIMRHCPGISDPGCGDVSSLWIISEWNYFVTPQSSHVGSHRVAISRGQICIFHRTDFVTFNPKIDNQFNLAFGEWIIFPFWWAISFTFRHNLTESKFYSPHLSPLLSWLLFTLCCSHIWKGKCWKGKGERKCLIIKHNGMGLRLDFPSLASWLKNCL